MGVGVKSLGVWWIVSLLCISSWAVAGSDLRLIDAVRTGDKDTVRSLLQERADVDTAQGDGATALSWAVYRDDLETAELLIGAGANVNAANDYGVTPLSLACTNRNAILVEKLLRAGANPNAALWTGETALMTCAHAGNAEAVKSLLAHQADVNAKDTQKGQTALMWAVSEKHPEVVRALIEQGADVNTKSRVVEIPTPLQAVTYSKDVHFPTSQGSYTPLMFAARVGDLESARILLEAGAKLNETTPADGLGEGSALLMATASGHEELAGFLLEQGADPNATDGYGIAPLHWALFQGIRALVGGRPSATDRYWYHSNMPQLVKSLLAHGADANARIQRDFPPYDNMLFSHTLNNNLPQISLVDATPFLLAAASGDSGSMVTLVEGRANPKLVTVDGTSPVMVAAGVGIERGDTRAGGNSAQAAVEQGATADEKQRALKALFLAVQLGGDVNAVNQEGRTALHGAAFLGDTEMIQFLAEHGADLAAKDKYGQTALSIALGDPEGLVYRQLPGDQFDYRFRQPRVQKRVADLLVKLGATPFTGKYRDRAGE